MLYLMLFFSGAIVVSGIEQVVVSSVATGSNIPGTLTWDCCCCICFVYMLQYFQERSPGVIVVVYAVIEGCCCLCYCSHVPIFQGLSPGDDVAVSAAVKRFLNFH
jgi:hypothetical protein